MSPALNGALDPATADYDSIIYNRYYNHLMISAYVLAGDVSDTSNLVDYDTVDTTGLVSYSTVGNSGLILEGAPATNYFYSYNTGQLYPQAIPAAAYAMAILQDPPMGQPVLTGDDGAYISGVLTDGAISSGARCDIALPMVAGKDYEVSGLSVFFDLYHSYTDIWQVSVIYGDGPLLNTETVTYSGGLGGLQRLDSWCINIRAKYVAFSIRSSAYFDRLVLQRIEAKCNLVDSYQ